MLTVLLEKWLRWLIHYQNSCELFIFLVNVSINLWSSSVACVRCSVLLGKLHCSVSTLGFSGLALIQNKMWHLSAAGSNSKDETEQHCWWRLFGGQFLFSYPSARPAIVHLLQDRGQRVLVKDYEWSETVELNCIREEILAYAHTLKLKGLMCIYYLFLHTQIISHRYMALLRRKKIFCHCLHCASTQKENKQQRPLH